MQAACPHEAFLGNPPHEPEDGGTTVLTPALSFKEREKHSQRLGKVLPQTVRGFNARIFSGNSVPKN
jgi:hypothetical protein